MAPLFNSLIPANEESRLQALLPYKVLTATPDAVFDEIVRLTAKLFDMPIALISLVDAHEVWFKANFGMANPARVLRKDSLCSVAILQDETIVFENLQAEPCRLVDPAVGEALSMRFYAGHPLVTRDGYNIGSLCIIDRKPHLLSEERKQQLQAVASVVAKLLDLRLRMYNSPKALPGMWLSLYAQLDQYLTRIDTLKELARWENDPASEAARNYQRSISEEADLVIQALQKRMEDISTELS